MPLLRTAPRPTGPLLSEDERAAELTVSTHGADRELRVDWISSSAFRDGRPGRVGLTFLPGKHGPSFRYPGVVYERDLVDDLRTLANGGVHRLVLLVEDSELERWGDPAIVDRGRDAGVSIERHPIPDMHPPASVDDMDRLAAWIDGARSDGDVAVACMGGVGRTGTVAACLLVAAGWSAADAIAEVRRVRHPTAVETSEQERFVESYAESKRRVGDTIG